MKFCKHYKRVADLSNPEWSPFFTDYKSLKKIIKRLSDIELDDGLKHGQAQAKPATRRCGDKSGAAPSPRSTRSTHSTQTLLNTPQNSKTPGKQGQGDRTSEVSPASFSSSSQPSSHQTDTRRSTSQSKNRPGSPNNVESIRQNPGEVLFFKSLHGEFQKAVHFFDRIIDEFSIREERVLEGLQIVQRENRFHLWSTLAKSVYRLYTDLLLMETFCIMTYCSFSKILKKHDKVTGFETRRAFMANVVNNANFTNYTNLQEMIARCEQLYSQVSNRMVQEGQENLYEDERLFIEMVHRLNQQV